MTISQQIQSLLSSGDIQINGSRPWDIRLHNSDFYNCVLSKGALGFGESYVDGWWDCPQLDQLFYRGLRSGLYEKFSGSALRTALRKCFSLMINFQSKRKAREVAERHYDIGNDLYTAMLDPSMNYSCGYWQNASTLEDAQTAKMDLICRKLYLQPGMSVLDIGCGWGGLAKYAAEHHGVSVVGVTISKEQQKLAQKKCKGLPIDIRLEDYRSLNHPFDRIVSVGMFEHVGYKNYKTFMQIANQCLKNNGLFLLHTIGSRVSTTFTDEWIHKYIFPNSLLPSAKQISDASEPHFLIEDWHNFGADYDKTLMAWYKNFENNWERLKTKYGEKFYRMWTYYLLSCAGSFRARDNQLWQVVFSKNGPEDGYHSVR